MRRLCLLLLVVACKKPPPVPTCSAITDHVAALMVQSAKNHEDMDLASKKSMLQLCEQRHMTDDEKRCMIAAQTLDAVGPCRTTPAVAPRRSDEPAPAASAKAGGSGSASGSAGSAH